MAYSYSLAARLRHGLTRQRNIEEKQMFGGLGFLLRGNMCLGVWKEGLIARIGPEPYSAALAEPHVREFDVTGRPMKGWVMVEPDGVESDPQLALWIDRAVEFCLTLPAK